MTLKTIYTYECWSSDQPSLMGCLFADTRRGKESCSFEYDTSWLKTHIGQYFLDPDLGLYRGRQYVPNGKSLFGIFEDSCPDRWGRMLMQRREAILAAHEDRKPNKLSEIDYLLGVHDEGRMGALRFSLQEGGPFLSCDSDMAAPPWVALRELEAASLAFEQDEDSLSDKWLRLLIAPGSSLGGARPKAALRAPDGTLWIAKFPSRHDEHNTGAWEQAVHEMAKICGLNVPESKLARFSAAGATFLVKRFDRDGMRRIHFSSAMSLLGQTDGASGSSYLDLADFITMAGASPREDLAELWQRIVFSMAVSNTDDHLRNHGFLLTENGWRLSPMYDVNPIPYGKLLSLNVAPEDPRIDLDLALDVASSFGLTPEDAEIRAKKILTTVRKQWRNSAAACGLNREEQNKMAPAFALCEKQ
ncbi:type II toxin-antitoxin system HipA family toxin [Succinimonas sp.]|uniref:type II toxin-antitoxin system HipA family toxin n=1 Tax=Succinimonas sp. TaxID=1936151 RepID=UPI0038634A67